MKKKAQGLKVGEVFIDPKVRLDYDTHKTIRVIEWKRYPLLILGQTTGNGSYFLYTFDSPDQEVEVVEDKEGGDENV